MKRLIGKLNAVQTLTLSFALLILGGAILLTLPVSAHGERLSFLDALFTAASASCVTGLSVMDPYTKLTLFGQVVLLLLIQIGGLSFMMVSILVSFLLGKRIGLRQRSLLMDTVGALKIGGVVLLIRRALIGTAVLEGTGALLLSTVFCPRFGFIQGLWLSVFHAISAFCNAGFDLLGIVEPGTSLFTVMDQPVVVLTLGFLIVFGGLGFVLWDDVLSKGLHFRKYRLHTKIVLVATGSVLVLSTIGFFLMEHDHAFAGMPFWQKLVLSFFQAVTPRTAGFATVPMNEFRPSSILLTMVLMFIGAGSGSTGGGIKINTFVVLVLSVVAYAKRQDDITAFRRRLDNRTVQKALSSVFIYCVACLSGCMVLCLQDLPLGESLFECFSAIGTVGLSLGLTAALPAASKVAIIILMFSGRVGSMSVAMAVTRDKPLPKLRYISENILIG